MNNTEQMFTVLLSAPCIDHFN